MLFLQQQGNVANHQSGWVYHSAPAELPDGILLVSGAASYHQILLAKAARLT